LKGGTYTDLNTAFAAEELHATPSTVLCSVPLSSVVYQKTGNSAASVFIPICAGAAPTWGLQCEIHRKREKYEEKPFLKY
jgi:hypothetical protein